MELKKEESRLTNMVLIVCYYGNFPSYFNLWIKSCEYNPTVNFKIFTDQPKPDYCPDNVEFVNLSLDSLKNIFEKKLGFSISIENPYKLCDYKPAYGFLLEEFIKEYDFWGHCDIDLIFGDVRNFISEEILSNYDRILKLGHFSLYRNCEKMNKLFMKKGSRYSYKEVFQSQVNSAFDETVGINSICNENNISVYISNCIADIDVRFKRFKLRNDSRNKEHQVFYWENGQLFRTYYKNNEVKTDNFMYIHLQKRTFHNFLSENNASAFYINEDGFYEKFVGEISMPPKNNFLKINYLRKYQDASDIGRYYFKNFKKFIASDLKTKKRIILYKKDVHL